MHSKELVAEKGSGIRHKHGHRHRRAATVVSAALLLALAATCALHFPGTIPRSLCRPALLPSPTRVFENKKEEKNIVFTHFGEMLPYQMISLLHARLSNPSAAIHVLMHTPLANLSQEWRRIANSSDLRLVHIRNHTSSREREFAKVYLPSSVNTFQYEYMCFARFFEVQEYAEAQGLAALVLMDIDIVLFKNMFEILPPDTTFTMHSTFAVHWTSRSLRAFSDFMFGFYQRDRRDIVADIQRFGDGSADFQAPLNASADIGAWWPAGVGRKHLSDMYLLAAFFQTQPGYLLLKCPTGCRMTEVPALMPMLSARTIDAVHQCANASSFRAAFQWQRSPSTGILQPHLRPQGDAVPGIHFQGGCKKVVPIILCVNVAPLAPALCAP
jgi:hypothetical protein